MTVMILETLVTESVVQNTMHAKHFLMDLQLMEKLHLLKEAIVPL
jgi:hypothetical protein